MAAVKVFKQIDPNDVDITPFKAYKEWAGISNADFSSSYGITVYRAIYPYGERYPNKIIPLQSTLASTEATNSNGTYQKLVYDSIRTQFYGSTSDFYYSKNSERHLFESASVMSIPQPKYGELVKKGSYTLDDYSVTQSRIIDIRDDSYGNLYDFDIPSGSFVSSSNLVGYWGFNDKYNLLGISSVNTGSTSCFQPHSYLELVNNNKHGTYSGATFSKGILTTGYSASRSGVRCNFNGYGSMVVENHDDFNFSQNDDFAISLWADLPVSQSDTTYDYNGLICKRGEAEKLFLNRETKKYYYKETDLKLNKYPFEIRVYNQNTTDCGKIYTGRSDGIFTCFVTSSTFLTGSQHHILFQKTGSTIELYIDGVQDTTKTDNVQYNVINDCKLIIGSVAKTRGNFSGSLDEIRLYNTALTQAQITALADNGYESGSAYQTTRIGNIFYENGMAVISDPRPKYENVFLGQTGGEDYGTKHGFNFTYNSTQTIYENKVLCRIKPDELTMTLNPTARLNDDYNSPVPKGFTSGSDWTPYITQIGLYDQYGRLLVVGKLASPLMKREDIDVNIVLRWDT